jgi:NAD(P)-dependent dehydrogenase (short-subunit alcohol dehydrogenase family)
MHGPQQGRIALVTGATQGIGAAIARRLAREGATVAVNGLTHDERMSAVVTQTAGFPAAGDISDPDAVSRLLDHIETTRGPIDILVCNAAYMTMAPFGEHDEKDWWKIIDTNLAGTFYLIQAALAGMRRTGGGNIVVIASEWGVIGLQSGTDRAHEDVGSRAGAGEHHRQRRRTGGDRHPATTGGRRQCESELGRHA